MRVLTAIMAGVLIVLAGFFWLRRNWDGQSDGAREVVSPDDRHATALPIDASSEGARPQSSPESSKENAPAATAGRAVSGGSDSEPRRSTQDSKNTDELVSASIPTSGVDDSRLDSPINCWKTNDPDSKEFGIELDRSTRTKGEASASIAPIEDTPNIGQLFQTVDAAPLRDNLLQVSADMRAKLAKRRAGLWIRAYDSQRRIIASNQALLIGPTYTVSGDVEWTTVDVALVIPKEAHSVSYGMTMGGTGQAWIDNVRVIVSGTTTAGGSQPEAEDATNALGNLDFEPGAGADCKRSRAQSDPNSR